MNLAIRYLTAYRYDGKVTDNLNALRVRPATTSTQRVDDFHVRVDPEARLQRHLDYYGTEVIEFGVAQPHDQLSIDVRARVVTAEPDEPPDEGWEALAASSYESAGLEALLPGGGKRGEPVWVGVDPTNRRLAGETHVKIGHGRTYADVPPIKGVYRGAAAAELDASVTMTRLDPQASARA